MKTKKIFLIILAVLAIIIMVIGGVCLRDTRKTFSLNGLEFSYPGSWQKPEYVEKLGQKHGEVKNGDGAQRIVVLTEINQGYSVFELSDFLNSIATISGNRINIDGSEAVKMNRITYQGSKITTVFLNAKDKKSQYSISYEVPESISDAEVDKIFDKVLSSIKLK